MDNGKLHLGVYAYNGKNPNAVYAITPVNDEVISKKDCQVAYNLFNQPASIKEDGNDLYFYYGSDLQRNKTIYELGNVFYEKYYYVSKYYEKKTGDNGDCRYHFIYGDDGAVALYIVYGDYVTPPYDKSAGVTRDGDGYMYYIHKDHLGSFVLYTNPVKTPVQRNWFDPWGNCPNYERGGGGEPSTEFIPPPRGFTGHEHYPAFKIINMNGRLYDPVIGRFFSPDNYVVDNENTQDFNRYSYARNNPLKYTDPDGQSYRDVDDHIEVDDMGRTTITQQPGKDVVWANGKSETLSGNGVFRTAYSEEMINGNPATLLTGLSRSDANKIFNLLGEKTKVEWGKLEVLNTNGGIDYFVGSSHSELREEIISSKIYDDNIRGLVQKYDHSHPLLHNRDVEGYRYSSNDEIFWNDLNRLHPNASAGIRFNKQYDLYYKNGVTTDKYDNPLFRYK